MAFLNGISLLGESLVVAQPKGLWEWLILTVFSFVANYGWRIVLFTVLLKIVLSPLDIFQRHKGRKNQKISERLAPQIEKLQKQYPDPQEFSRKQMELQKKEGFSYFSSCLPAIATMVIFITLLLGLNKISAYYNFTQYQDLYETYNAAVTEYDNLGAEKDEVIGKLRAEGHISESYKKADDTVWDDRTQYAQYKVALRYEETKISFLWIENIWSPDVPWKKEINNKTTFEQNIGDYAKNPEKMGLDATTVGEMIAPYDTVMGRLLDTSYNRANGYLILPVLSVGLSFLMQWITMRQQKKSGQVNDAMGGGSTMKMMMFMMPVLMGIFSLSYTACFSLYLVVNYLVSLAISLSSSLLFIIIDKNAAKKAAETVHKYGRPDPNDVEEK
ncbi:MAG: YidC/Oxa1 family membrane protein insertase [Christensenellales bacterium]